MFRRLGIPEIQDLVVIPQARQRGIGTALVEHCEARALVEGHSEIGIGVGLYGSYGAAQRLYIKRGYVPDGQGVAYECQPVMGGEIRPVDDDLVLKLIKNLAEQ